MIQHGLCGRRHLKAAQATAVANDGTDTGPHRAAQPPGEVDFRRGAGESSPAPRCSRQFIEKNCFPNSQSGQACDQVHQSRVLCRVQGAREARTHVGTEPECLCSWNEANSPKQSIHVPGEPIHGFSGPNSLGRHPVKLTTMHKGTQADQEPRAYPSPKIASTSAASL